MSQNPMTYSLKVSRNFLVVSYLVQDSLSSISSPETNGSSSVIVLVIYGYLYRSRAKISTIFHFRVKCWKEILLVCALCGKEGPRSIAVSVNCIEPGQWIVNVRIKSAELTIDVCCGVSSILLIGLGGVRVSKRYHCAPGHSSSSSTEQLSSKRANQSGGVLSLRSLKLVYIVLSCSKYTAPPLRNKAVVSFIEIVAVYFKNVIKPIKMRS